jgi:ATP-dependent DNA ligase
MTKPTLASIELMHAMDHHPFSGDGWIFELKYDGCRVLASKT